MSGLTPVVVRKKTIWTPHLMTIELARDDIAFNAGQFFNLGLQVDGEVLRRSYSAASAPGKPLEFFLSEVAGPGLTPRVFGLNEGEEILLDTQPLGFFTLAEVPEAKDLWLVATGTGLGPYISMLREGQVLDRFDHVIVVHGVRGPAHLAYQEELRARAAREPRFVYLPTLSGSGEASPDALAGRITTTFEAGDLESAAGRPFDKDAHMLLCGNPQMIDEMTGLLKGRGFEKHRRRKPGHFNFERYW